MPRNVEITSNMSALFFIFLVGSGMINGLDGLIGAEERVINSNNKIGDNEVKNSWLFYHSTHSSN